MKKYKFTNLLCKIVSMVVLFSIPAVIQAGGFDDPRLTQKEDLFGNVHQMIGGSLTSSFPDSWIDERSRPGIGQQDFLNRHVGPNALTPAVSEFGISTSGNGWHIERAVYAKRFSWMTDRSLTLDSNGNPHIAYGQSHLYYAWYDGEWDLETVDDTRDVGLYASLALDTDGYPHISYYDRADRGNLKYAYKDASGWHIQTVDSDGTVGWFTSLALDASGHPHISYYDATNHNIKYAYRDGSQWHIETVDSDGVVGYWCTSLVIDANDIPHISYFDWDNGNLKYAYLQVSQWYIQTVDDDEDVGGYNSLVVDENGYPHISYLDYANANLKYAFMDDSGWHIQTVDGNGDVGWYNSLALDEDNHPHISYGAYSGNNLKYAYWDGSDWSLEIVNPQHDFLPSDRVGRFSSLALDASGKPHISHYGSPSQSGALSLRYAYHDGSYWQHKVLDDYWDMRGATSIAIDDNENPHIGFWRSDYSLGYTRWDGNMWTSRRFTPDSPGIVMREPGSGSFLSLDGNGNPHMIYYQQWLQLSSFQSYSTFVRVWFDGTEWKRVKWFSNTMNYNIYPRSSSLFIDENGMYHICVYKLTVDSRSIPARFSYEFQYIRGGVTTTIDSGRDVGVDNSLAIDNEGVPHISYRGLRYAHRVGPRWKIQILDSKGYGEFNSLKVDSNNHPHISYYDTLNTALKYARWNGSDWSFEIVDSSGDVGKYTSLALDTKDYPHISYYDETNGALKYARWNGKKWIIETVDSYSVGSVGLYTSLALDSDDKAHISYYDHRYGDLKYATTSTIILVDDMNGSGLPGDFMLFQNYPNPFNPTTTIRYTLPERRQVNLKVYNTLGQEVTSLVNEVIEPGLHEVVFDASSLPSGVYIYRIEAGEYVESKKLLFLK